MVLPGTERSDMSIRTKRIVVLVIGLFVTLFAFLIVSNMRKSDKTHLILKVAPPKAVVTLNDKKTDKDSYQKPGKYTVKISRDGFATYKKEITIQKGQDELVMPVSLVPESTEARREAAKYEKEYKELEVLSGKKVNEAGQALQSKYPILSSLPYRSSIYSIEYGTTKEQEFVIQIFAKSPATRQVALAKIRDWGYDPADYPIHFVDIRNPFDPDLQVGDE